MMGEFAEKLFLGILNMSVTGSIVILAMLLVRVFLRKVPRVFSYLLWAVVLFRLLCPVSFTADFSLLRALPVSVQGQGNLAYVSMQPDFFETVDEIPTIEDVHKGNTALAMKNEAITYEIAESFDFESIVVAVGSRVWLLGIGCLLVYSAVTLLKLKSKLKTAHNVNGNVYLTKAIETPFVIGFFRPRIYLPAMLLEEEKNYILMHEKIHIKRGDHIVKIVSFLTLCLHWFNPLVWLAFFLSGKDMEMSCDEAVIRKAGNSVKKEYSSSLLSLATGKRIVSGVPLAFGEGDTGSRIKNVLKYKKPAKIVAVIALAVCVVVAVVLLANPGKKTQNGDGAGNNTPQATGQEETKEILYGVVTEVEVVGSVRKVLYVPRFGEIDIPGEAMVSVSVERESQELLPGDLVQITFAEGQEIAVLETWPGRFSGGAESIIVLCQGGEIVYEGENIYQFSMPASLVTDSEDVESNDILKISSAEGGEVLAEIPVYIWYENADGNKMITVRITTEFMEHLLAMFASDIRFSLEKPVSPESIVLGENAEGTYQVNVRSLDKETRSIDSYVSNYQSSYDGGAPLYFAEDCVFRVNNSMWGSDYKEISFDEFVELIGEEDPSLNQPCQVTFADNRIVEIALNSVWNKQGIKADFTPPISTFYEYVVKEEGEEVFEECYSLTATETMDVADCAGEEMIEIYTGNLGDGDSGFVFFKDAQGKLLYTQDAHSARAGWNNIYLGETQDGAFILNVYIEDRWDYGGYGYWVYRLSDAGEVMLIAGSRFDFEFSENSNYQYDDELFKEWIAPMEFYLENSHLILSTQEGEVRTEKVSEADKYNYETLNLKDR